MVDNIFHKYLYKKRGFYYFCRHIPKDVQKHYKKKRIVFSLKTRSSRLAFKASRNISQKLDDYWMSLRLTEWDIPGKDLIRNSNKNSQIHVPLLSEALSNYLRLKGSNKSEVFFKTSERNIKSVTDLFGDKPITEYSTAEAAQLRDHFLDRGLNVSSVKRNISNIRAVFSLTLNEFGIDHKNPFSNIYLPELSDNQKRQPIDSITLKSIQDECKSIDDEKRWLIALISDTGMRLAEAAGLHLNDIHLETDFPHVDIKPHAWRPLKTKTSERKVPLIGAALWSARKIMESGLDENFAFPIYTNSHKCNANSASATLNKWLHQRAPEGCVIHSFRHSLRDRLRAVECPTEIIDQIGGWTTSGIGSKYGKGYEIEVLSNWMNKIANC